MTSGNKAMLYAINVNKGGVFDSNWKLFAVRMFVAGRTAQSGSTRARARCGRRVRAKLLSASAPASLQGSMSPTPSSSTALSIFDHRLFRVHPRDLHTGAHRCTQASFRTRSTNLNERLYPVRYIVISSGRVLSLEVSSSYVLDHPS